jgi:endoglucanase
LPWFLVDASSGKTVASGKTEALPYDLLSGDAPQVADFSSFRKSGSYYILVGDRRSPSFRIGADVLSGLALDSLKYFYRSRSGVELKKEFAGATWAREAGHLTDSKVAAFGGADAQGKAWEGYDFLVDGSGGWYDAGDFGKYVVNGGISVWTLQDAYERSPASFKDGQLGIPESGNGRPDILDEARWELEFMLRMQIPEGKKLAGMCFHKLHDRKWSSMPCALPATLDNNIAGKDGWSWGRFAYEPTTAATLNLAACAAQAARLWAPLDEAFSRRCLDAARAAWKAARENPALLAGNVPGDGGGNYDDKEVADEFFWAAAELFATTGEDEYSAFLKASPCWKAIPGLDGRGPSAMSWSDTAALGAISLLSSRQAKLAAPDRAALAAQLLAAADRYLEAAGRNAYGAPIGAEGYLWGSNSIVLNDAIVLALAYDLTKKAPYRDAVLGSMDYILGYNALRRSFVTGYGACPPLHPHHRVWANDPDSGFVAPPPGVLAGGPDKSVEDPEMKAAGLSGLPIAKRYVDLLGSFATNEVAINWNAPLAWVSGWLCRQYGGK